MLVQAIRYWWTRSGSSWPQYLISVLVVAGVTPLALFVNASLGYRAIAFIYLLAVVAMAPLVGRGPTLLAAVISALLWDFFFEEPLYSLRISRLEDQILFATYFIVALVLGQLTSWLRAQEKAERHLSERTMALYLLNQELARATEIAQILQASSQHLRNNFGAEIAFLLPDANDGLKLEHNTAASFGLNQEDQLLAASVFQNGHQKSGDSGASQRADILFLPLRGSRSVLGVVGLRHNRRVLLSLHQRNMLESLAQEIALAIDRLHVREILEQTKLLAESERLSKTLLNSISHEIRTPLAVIEAAGSNLIDCKTERLSETQRTMIAEIRLATDRLNRLVGNILDITRLESGHVKPRADFCQIGELVTESVAECRGLLSRHVVRVEIAPNLPFVRFDMSLMHQVIVNLLSNVAFHTPEATRVDVTASNRGGSVALTIADRGPGVDPKSLPHLFEKFYRAPNARTGGTGLGLSIVKGFVEAQGGQVLAENREGGGTVFTVLLPIDQLSIASADEILQPVT